MRFSGGLSTRASVRVALLSALFVLATVLLTAGAPKAQGQAETATFKIPPVPKGCFWMRYDRNRGSTYSSKTADRVIYAGLKRVSGVHRHMSTLRYTFSVRYPYRVCQFVFRSHGPQLVECSPGGVLPWSGFMLGRDVLRQRSFTCDMSVPDDQAFPDPKYLYARIAAYKRR